MTQINTTSWQVILNPHAGCNKGSRDKDLILALLDKSGLQYQLSISEFAGHTFEIAHQLANKGATHFIIAGGDGTLNETVNGIFNGDYEKADKIVIGVIPVGTGNDWIRTFGIPDNYQSAIDIIKAGHTVVQDVGEIGHPEGHAVRKRYFVNIAGFGFDAMVAGRANYLKNKGISGLRVYIQSFIWSFIKFNAANTEFIIDHDHLHVYLFSASIGLGKFNGGGMMQVPEANPLNGLFHLTIIRKMGVGGILKNFKGLYDGSFVGDRRVSVHSCKSLTIRSAKPLPGEADGEALGSSQFHIQIIPHKLRVIFGSDKYLH